MVLPYPPIFFLSIGSFIIPLYILRNSFFNHGVSPLHEFFDILPGFSTPLLIRRKFDELVIVTMYFNKSLQINIIKIQRATNEPKFNEFKILNNSSII
jgi:hypothetical protein